MKKQGQLTTLALIKDQAVQIKLILEEKTAIVYIFLTISPTL
jgi:hypothetical protein